MLTRAAMVPACLVLAVLVASPAPLTPPPPPPQLEPEDPPRSSRHRLAIAAGLAMALGATPSVVPSAGPHGLGARRVVHAF